MIMDDFWDMAVPVLRRVWPVVFLAAVFGLVMIFIVFPIFVSIPLALVIVGLSPNVIVPVYTRLLSDTSSERSLPMTNPDLPPRWMRPNRPADPALEANPVRSPTATDPSVEPAPTGTAEPAAVMTVRPDASPGTDSEPIGVSRQVLTEPLQDRSNANPGARLIPHPDELSAQAPGQPARDAGADEAVAQTPAGLATLPAQAFQDHCAAVLERRGYRDLRDEISVPDTEAVTPNLTGRDSLGRRTVILCRQDAPGTVIGRDVVQAFLERRDATNRLDRAAIVTTGRFDPLAVRLARQHDIALIDGDELQSEAP